MLSRAPHLQPDSSAADTPTRRVFLKRVAICALLACVLLPASASAQMREFTGEVQSASGKKLVVGNRMGDSVSFTRVDETRVTGAKSSWGALAKGDRVTVKWKESRKAYSVRVLPPRKAKKRD